MKWIFLACSLLTSATLFSQKIVWRENRKLTWSDFKSPANTKNNSDIVAYTHCGLQYTVIKSSDPKSYVKIEIETIFNEDKSWKDVKRINDYILGHEQKHFDITEIYARKLRKEVAEKIKTSGDYDRSFKSIYNRILNDYKAFQMAYDKDTKHGMDKEKQAQYNITVEEELENLKSYQKS